MSIYDRFKKITRITWDEDGISIEFQEGKRFYSDALGLIEILNEYENRIDELEYGLWRLEEDND